ncbi:MarR family winged helix-turn-helix transcriptional regulator [Lentilactobacillus kosonis]|uniref:Organic hydroperoxide resistance transcriptional regulator n=1 Tax=Lentilactobacillus kosonis TaxID=2810561 RepID=A0A401FHV3_9LACO|nr:MarR family transcriptional regulator [Lentilactobacillus kosonis]GAY71927.1 organic hydroperoxide resistance transcriptional regulator [Lentilactobacillus kosonis]
MADALKKQEAMTKLLEFSALQHVSSGMERQHSDHDKTLVIQGQGKILLALLDQDQVSQKDLAQKLNLTPQSTAEFVRKLEKKGDVTRTKSESDRRLTIVSLTTAGKGHAHDLWQTSMPFLNVLDDTELVQLSSILAKINGSMYETITQKDHTWIGKLKWMLVREYMDDIHDGETKSDNQK